MAISKLTMTLTVKPRFNVYISALMVYFRLPVRWAFKIEVSK